MKLPHLSLLVRGNAVRNKKPRSKNCEVAPPCTRCTPETPVVAQTSFMRRKRITRIARAAVRQFPKELHSLSDQVCCPQRIWFDINGHWSKLAPSFLLLFLSAALNGTDLMVLQHLNFRKWEMGPWLTKLRLDPLIHGVQKSLVLEPRSGQSVEDLRSIHTFGKNQAGPKGELIGVLIAIASWAESRDGFTRHRLWGE
jgi:hypothetical protein